MNTHKPFNRKILIDISVSLMLSTDKRFLRNQKLYQVRVLTGFIIHPVHGGLYSFRYHSLSKTNAQCLSKSRE